MGWAAESPLFLVATPALNLCGGLIPHGITLPPVGNKFHMLCMKENKTLLLDRSGLITTEFPTGGVAVVCATIQPLAQNYFYPAGQVPLGIIYSVGEERLARQASYLSELWSFSQWIDDIPTFLWEIPKMHKNSYRT